jgi:nucleoid DNA-binding protein
MQDIVKMVAAKAGISESVARIAVEAVISILKDKLPGALGSQLESFLGVGSGKPKSKSTKTTKTTSKVSKASKEDNLLGGLTDLIGGFLSKK